MQTENEDVVEAWRRKAFLEGFNESFLEGFNESFLEGFHKGFLEGFHEGERTLLLRLLRHRFGDQVDHGVEQRLAAATIEQLERWAVRLLSIATLAELLAGERPGHL